MGREESAAVRRKFALAGIAMILSGCAAEPTVTGDIRPIYRIEGGQTSAQYDAGKRHFAAGDYGLALDAFNHELKRSPDSILALNGIAACYDKLKRHDVATRYYHRALALSPESVRTLNNLGYSLLLQGRHEEAHDVLQLALRHDPDNAFARENLAQVTRESPLAAAVAALEEKGVEPAAEESAPATEAVSEADPTEPMPVAPAAIAEAPAPVETIAEAVPAEPAPENPIATAEAPAPVETIAEAAPAEPAPENPIAIAEEPAPVETIAEAAPAEPPPAAQAAHPRERDLQRVHHEEAAAVLCAVEFSNGNGRDGMARLMGRYFDQKGVRVTRLTNATSFSEPRTRVLYVPGMRAEAERVATRLPVEAVLEETRNNRADIDVRVVLGADMLAHVAAIRAALDGPSARLISVSTSPDAWGKPLGIGLEVSNGNGVTGMARLMSGVLTRLGERVDRITNAGHFDHPHTRILYAPGFEAAARSLASRLPVPADVKESDRNRPGIAVRIIIGRDLLHHEIVALLKLEPNV